MPKKLIVVYMGTPMFAVSPLISLINDSDFEVAGVLTQEDKKTGRKMILTAPPVKTAATENNIPVLQPPSLKNNMEITDLLSGIKPDFIVVAAYGKMLPKTILDIPRHGCINIHASLLPKYRGASPIETSILNGDDETGISFILMTSKLDAGPIFNIFRHPIKPTDTAETLRSSLASLAAAQLPFILKDIASGLINPIPQDHQNATYCSKINKEDGYLNLFETTAKQAVNMIRAYTPWPGCFLVLDGKKIKLHKANFDETSDLALKTSPYELIDIGNHSIGIGSKKGLLLPLEIQMEGKKPVDIHSFLRGNRPLLIKLLESAKTMKSSACP